jgi:hypothetical protein
VDIVMDRDLGPQILELNARPGLAIQIANNMGLELRLKAIEAHRKQNPNLTPAQRVEYVQTQLCS